jgi:NAD(P)-dependent dehydrogenase (short-subunit alcohol dehydrogenase family)
MDFASKAVLITGGSRGIGRAVAHAFLDAGARVAVNGRTAASVAAAIQALGGGERLVAAPGDVATVAGCEAAVAAALDRFGGLDILVNSAGIYSDVAIEHVDEAYWDAMIDINLKGTFFATRAALPALRARKGNVVNLSSNAGLQGYGRTSVYCASKGGITNMTRAMALELSPVVRVNCVCPGWVDTDMVAEHAVAAGLSREALDGSAPMARMATAQEVARSILYLASADAGFITGVALPIDGGGTAGR